MMCEDDDILMIHYIASIQVLITYLIHINHSSLIINAERMCWAALLSLFLWIAIIQEIINHPSAAAFSTKTDVASSRMRCRIRRASSLHESIMEGIKKDTISKQKQQLVAEFVSKVETAIQEQTFASLTLRGVKKTKSKNPEDAAALRGSIRHVQGRLIQVKNAHVMLQLTLKYHGATDICKNIAISEIVDALPQLILDPMASEWGIDAVQAKPIQGAELKTLTNAFDLQLQNNKPKLVKRKAANASSDASPAAHDREKNVPLSRKADFLQALGLSNFDGKPKPGMKSKLSQCQKFVEIVGGLVNKMDDSTSKPISVIDMGCGRGRSPLLCWNAIVI
jgi:hypothetical protein